MEYDLLIKNGSVIDGTGSATKQADLGIKDGIIVSIGQVEGEARRYVRKSEGYDVVIVNGAIAYQDGRYTETLNGRVV